MSSIFLKNGYIVDGTGRSGFIGSVFIKEDHVKEIYKGVLDIIADECIDVGGRVIAPGFIDMYSCSDVSSLSFSKADSKICQGVTTEIVGVQGWSAFPSFGKNVVKMKKNNTVRLGMADKHYFWDSIDSYSQALISYGLYSNVGTFIGYSSLRMGVRRALTKTVEDVQVQQMCDLLEDELVKGAFGMSVEWVYLKDYSVNLQEIKILSKIIADHEGLLSVHLCSESEQILKTVKEFIFIAQETGVKLHFSAIEVTDLGRNYAIHEIITVVKKARANGLIITCDQFVYDTAMTELLQLIPASCQAEDLSGLITRLVRPDAILRKDIRNEIQKRGGAEQIIIADVGKYFSAFKGKSLATVAMLAGIPPEEVVTKLLTASGRPIIIRVPALDVDTLGTVLQEDFITVVSGGAAYPCDREAIGLTPYLGSFGTFPHFIELVRTRQLMGLEAAICKITKVPADILRLTNRGILEKGALADIVVFDYEGCHDNGSSNYPFPLPSGIQYVIVGGKIAVRDGRSVNQRNGVMLYHR